MGGGDGTGYGWILGRNLESDPREAATGNRCLIKMRGMSGMVNNDAILETEQERKQGN